MSEELEEVIKIQARLIGDLYLKLDQIDQDLIDRIEDLARKIYEMGIEL